jgi:hypothetical protein
MSTAADRGRRRGDSPATPFMIVVSGALLIAVGAGIAVHNLVSNQPTAAGEVAGQVGGFTRPSRPEGAALPVGPSPATSTSRRGAPTSRVPVPAIPPTASPVPVPSPAPINYEAEATDVIRSDGVSVFPFPGASGGQVVGNVRDGRTVRFVNIAVEGQGNYPMVVAYLARSPHVAQIRVNDGAPIPLSFPAVDTNQVGVVTLPVLLLVGLNTIEFGGDCPALDRITI